MNIHEFHSADDLCLHLLAGVKVYGIKRGSKSFDITDVIALVSVRDMDAAALVSLTDEQEAGRQLAKAVRAKCRQLAGEIYAEHKGAAA
jgi:hypothetical protein